MLFNSLNFIIFFIITVCLYYFLPYKPGIYMLLFASYIFYMCWNPALIVIIVFITFINFVAAALIYSDSQKSRRNLYLSLCMLINFGTLFVFKYLDFACGALNSVLSAFNAGFSVTPPEIVLPMGISFYTFQAAAYTIDVYRGELKPSRSYVRFSLFITFFPQLVAGPIERSRNLIRQFDSKNRFRMRNVLTGLEMMTVGFFKKVVIADRIAVGVNTVFNNPGSYSGLYYILAVFMFTVQIYCDFSGYSDIARGAAKVLGFRQTHGVFAAGQLFPSLCSSFHDRILEKVAHIAFHMVYGLYLYTSWRKQEGKACQIPQPVYYIYGKRPVAWGGLHICYMGCPAWRIPYY